MTMPTCPYCAMSLGIHVAGSEDQPQAPIVGAVCICMMCAKPSFFDHGPFGLILRLPTAEEWTEMRANEELMASLREANKLRWRYQLQPGDEQA